MQAWVKNYLKVSFSAATLSLVAALHFNYKAHHSYDVTNPQTTVQAKRSIVMHKAYEDARDFSYASAGALLLLGGYSVLTGKSLEEDRQRCMRQHTGQPTSAETPSDKTVEQVMTEMKL